MIPRWAYNSADAVRLALLSTVLLGARLASAGITIDVNSRASIKSAAKIAMDGLMAYYPAQTKGSIPGLFPYPPYYWWESGAAFGALVDYWALTGDSSNNAIVSAGLLHQSGDNYDYQPRNQSFDLGNDDQAFWGFAAMAAAERNFPDPPEGKPGWLALAQAVFNTQVERWDDATCNGGLRWQVFVYNAGYDYKNTISNGCLFQLAARLGKYTGNRTYFEWAEKIYDWSVDEGLISDDYRVFDGFMVTNCSNVNRIQWSYNSGTYMMGAAVMWNATKNSKWKKTINGLMNMNQVFFTNTTASGPRDTMFEVACEPPNRCNIDQRSFKAYLSAWLALTAQLAPWTKPQITPLLKSSARGAAKSCSGGSDGVTCGLRWYTGSWDGSYGLGEQLAAMAVFQSLLVEQTKAIVNSTDGGTSKGDPNAGSKGGDSVQAIYDLKVTRADKAGAGILTAITCGLVVGMTWFMAFSKD